MSRQDVLAAARGLVRFWRCNEALRTRLAGSLNSSHVLLADLLDALCRAVDDHKPAIYRWRDLRAAVELQTAVESFFELWDRSEEEDPPDLTEAAARMRAAASLADPDGS